MSSSIEQLSIQTERKRLKSNTGFPQEPFAYAWSRLKRVPTAYAALWIIALMIALALVSWSALPLTPYTYDETSREILSAPSWAHPM